MAQRCHAVWYSSQLVVGEIKPIKKNVRQEEKRQKVLTVGASGPSPTLGPSPGPSHIASTCHCSRPTPLTCSTRENWSREEKDISRPPQTPPGFRPQPPFLSRPTFLDSKSQEKTADVEFSIGTTNQHNKHASKWALK